MPYRVLGRTGVKVHPICLGTMNFGGRTPPEEAHRILDVYSGGGGNFIDTANVYNDGRSESIIGDWFKTSGGRDKAVLSTKVHGKRSDHVNDRGAAITESSGGRVERRYGWRQGAPLDAQGEVIA